MADCAGKLLVLRVHLAVLIAFCSGLLACGGPTASQSDGGLDGAADSKGDIATRESDGPIDQQGTDAGDATLSDASGPNHGPTDGGPTDADSGGTNVAGDAMAPSEAPATAYLGNPAHSGSNLEPSLVPPLAAIWSFVPSVGTTVSYPLIAGGRVYLEFIGNEGGATQQLAALDEHTGAMLWGPVDLGARTLAGQAYDGERVFTQDTAGLVRAFDAATGAALWTHALMGSAAADLQQPTAYGGLFYTILDNGVLTALDEATGKVAWTAPLDFGGFASPAVTDDGVFVALGNQNVYAFDRTSGSVLWHHLGSGSGTGATPQVYDRRIFVSELDPTPAHTDVYDALNGGFIATMSCGNSALALEPGHAYCSHAGMSLQAFDLTTGLPNWSFSSDASQVSTDPFAVGGTVYVGSGGTLFGVDESTGMSMWSAQTGGFGEGWSMMAGEGVLLLPLYSNVGIVAYAHFDQPDASVVLGDGAAPMPIALVPSVSPYALALDDTNVYWADLGPGQIGRAPKSGGSPTVLWSSPTTTPTTTPEALAVDATNVYFVASGDGVSTKSQIMSVPIAGGTASALASTTAPLRGPIAVGPSQVYWVDGAIQSVPKAGGTVTSVVPGVAASAFAVDASNLYWSGSDGIHAQPFAGGSGTLFVPPNPGPKAAANAIAVDATNVYYALSTSAVPGIIGYFPIAGGPATVLASGRPGAVAIAVDAQNVYWVEGLPGTINKVEIAAVPKTGGNVTVLVSGISNPENCVAADSTGVYFPNVGGGLGKIAN